MEIRAEKEAEKMRKDMLSKKDSGLAKMMQKFAGDQRSVMLKTTWTAWTEYHAEVKIQKELDGKKDTQLSRMMGKFARDQGAVLMRTVFGYWLDINKQARSRRFVHRRHWPPRVCGRRRDVRGHDEGGGTC